MGGAYIPIGHNCGGGCHLVGTKRRRCCGGSSGDTTWYLKLRVAVVVFEWCGEGKVFVV